MYTQNQKAFTQPVFPVNPLPFLLELTDLIRTEGTVAINSDKGKMLLLTINMQSYGHLATIDLCDEFSRLSRVILNDYMNGHIKSITP